MPITKNDVVNSGSFVAVVDDADALAADPNSPVSVSGTEGVLLDQVVIATFDSEFAGNTADAQDDWKTSAEDVAAVVLHLLKHPKRSLPSRVEMRPSQPPK